MKTPRFVGKNDLSGYLVSLDQNVVLIYSPTALAHLDVGNLKLRAVSYKDYSNDIDQLRDLSRLVGLNKTIVGMGGGSAMDAAKFVAHETNSTLICIPSMLSTNTYATNKAALNKAGQKTTVEAKLPDEIILDTALLSLNKHRNLLGLADVLSIHTALKDWLISNEFTDEAIDRNIYRQANGLLGDAVAHILATPPAELASDLDWLYRTIYKSGSLTNRFGSGRPESGSEHIFAKILESELNITHGASVSLGILVSSIMQQNVSPDVITCIQKLGALDELETIALDYDALFDALARLRPRADRYSIIDRVDMSDEYIELLIERLDYMVGTTSGFSQEARIKDLTPSPI